MSRRAAERKVPDIAIPLTPKSPEKKGVVLEMPKRENMERKDQGQDFAEQSQREAKLMTVTVEHLESALSEMRRTWQNLNAEPVVEPPVEGSAATIKEKLQNMPQVLQSLLGAQEISLKAAKETVKEISEISIHGEHDLQRLTQLIDRTAPLLKSVAENLTQIKRLQQSHENLQSQYKSAAVKEAGFESVDNLYSGLRALQDRQWEIRKKINELRSWRKGFGLIKRKNISDLRKEELQLAARIDPLYHVYESTAYSTSLPSLPYADQYTPKRETESAEQVMARSTVHGIMRRYEELLQEVSKEASETKVNLDDSQIESLNDDFLQRFFYPRLERKVAELKEQGRDTAELTDPQNIERAQALLKRAFDLRINVPWLGEPEQDIVQAQELQQQVEQLPRELKDIVANFFSQGKRAMNIAYNDMANFALNAKTNKQKTRIEAEYRKTLVRLEGLVRRRHPFDFYDEGAIDKAKKGLKESPTQKGLNDFVDNFEGYRWEVFISNEGIKELAGADNLELADRYLAGLIRERLLDTAYQDDKYWDMQGSRQDHLVKHGEALTHFRYTESMPIAILSAYRDLGGSSNDRKIKLEKLISSLNAQELSQLESQNVSGMTEVVKLIRENPNNFYQYVIRNEKGEWVENPVYYKIQQKMIEMSAQFLQSSDPRVRYYTSGVFKNMAFVVDITKPRSEEIKNNWEVADKAMDNLLSSGEQKVREEIVSFLEKRALHTKDEAAVDILLKNWKNIGVGNFEETAKKLVGVLAAFEHPKPEHIEALSSSLGLQKGDLNKTLNFLAQTKDIYESGYGSPYEPQYLQPYIELARNPEMLSLILELSQYGYKFNVRHAKELNSILSKKEEIIKSIQEIRQLIPTFEYKLASYSGYNEDTKAVETRYVFEPKGILAQRELPELLEINAPEQAAEVKLLYFEAYREHNSQMIPEQITKFALEFNGLPEEEKNTIIEGYIADKPEHVMDRFNYIKLNDQQKDQLVESLVRWNKHDRLVGLWDEQLGFNRGKVLLEILNSKPEMVITHGLGIKITTEEYNEFLERRIQNFLYDISPSKYNQFYEVFSKIIPDGKNIPDSAWGDMYRRLLKLQSQSGREEYDPWKTDLDPLVKQALEGSVLNRENQRDSEVIYSFVHEYGMYNLPTILRWHTAIVRAREIADISQEVRQEITSALGVDIDRLPNKGFITQEIKKFRDKIQADLIADKTPQEIANTQAGLELFLSLKGSTKWERGGDPQQIIRMWLETTEKQPELAKLPEGYREVEFKVPVAKRKELDAEQQRNLAEELDKVLQNPELSTALSKLEAAYGKALNIQNIAEWWNTQKAECINLIDSDITDIEASLDRTPEQWDALIQSEADTKKQEVLIKKRKALTSAQGRTGFENQRKQLIEKRSEIEGLAVPELLLADLSAENETKLAAFLEQLNKTLPVRLSNRDDIIRTLSAAHALGVMSEGQRDLVVNEVGTHATGTSWAKENVANWRSHLYDYLNEHYLNSEQKPSHISHTPFSNELVRDLQILWGTKGIKKNIIIQKEAELHALESGSFEATTETAKVSMVPARGILRIYSGDLGDACYTSKHEQLASGQYPKLTSYTFVTGRGTKNEKLAGSVLAIETTTPTGESVLLVRANNPQESFVQKVDADALIAKTLEELKALAARRGIQHVVVPRDQASASCSNRRQVAEFYSNNFGKNEAVELTNEPATNFNGYPNWNSKGAHKTVKIN